MVDGYSEKDYHEALASVNNGAFFLEQLFDEKQIHHNFFVFLFSKDDEINRYTINYLPTLKRIRDVSKFIIVMLDSDAEEILQEANLGPISVVKITEDTMISLSRFFVCFSGQFSAFRMVVNGTCFTEESAVFQLNDAYGINKEDIVKQAVFGMEIVYEETPETGLSEKTSYLPIDWEKKENRIEIYKDVSKLTLEKLVERGIRRLFCEGKITSEDKIVVCTVTKTSRQVIHFLNHDQVVAVIDNNEEMDGTTLDGIPVYQTEAFLKAGVHENFKFIVGTRSYKAICEQLNYYGYKLNQNVFAIYWREDYDLPTPFSKILTQYMELGKQQYERLRKCYPSEKFYLCPYPGTGDAFLVGMYLRTMREQHHETDDYVVLVASHSCRKILLLFNIDAVVMNQDQAEKLLYFSKIMGFEKLNVKVLNDGYRLLRSEFLRGYKGLDFHSLFQKSVFAVTNRLPFPQVQQENSDELFSNYGLVKGQTVVLSPYANTVLPVAGEVWEEVVRILKKKNYTVCTNVATEKEAAVKGTVGVFIPYSKILDFLNKAGGFIGLRSGLCDIIAGAKTKKIIIYPTGKTFDRTTAYNYFSLKKMFPESENIKELEITPDGQNDLFREVIDMF